MKPEMRGFLKKSLKKIDQIEKEADRCANGAAVDKSALRVLQEMIKERILNENSNSTNL